MKVPEYAQDTPVVEWKRPSEIWHGEEPAVLMKDAEKPGDVKQGVLDDCWLLGAFLNVSVNPQILQNLIVKDGLQFGFAVFKFFKNGEWQYVKIDTRIPYNAASKQPLYGYCADGQEFWVPLMEKAYAKLHKSYEILNGGKMSEALVDLTGMVTDKYDLRSPEMRAAIESGQFWKDLKKYISQGFLVGCANIIKDQDGKPEQGFGPKGILFNHTYSIQRLADCPDFNQANGGLQLVRIRNPWGSGQGEWGGPFCDEDEAWDDNKGLQQKLDYEFSPDGNWWMKFDDWRINYTKVYVTKIFPASWNLYGSAGEWSGNTAGGEYPFPKEDKGEGHEETKDKEVQLDTNDRWFNNPQYRVSVTKKTQLIISLMQEDFKVCGKPLIPVNFLVVRVKSKWNRLWEVDREDVVLNACPGGSSTELRELTRTLWLTPTHDKKPCHYIIVPNTEVDGRFKEEERPFYLRLFASEPLEFYQLPPTLEIPFTNKWGPSTAGGKRVLDNGKENQLWCRNPQYFLNIRKSTHLKIILRKKGGRRIRGVPLGITVTKANGPTVPPATTIIGKGRAGNKVPSSMPLNGVSYAETLRTVKKQQN